MNQAQDRAKNFCVRYFTGWRQVIENGWLHEVAVLVFGNLRLTAVEQNFGTLPFPGCDERLDALLARGGNDRSHLDALLEAIPDAQAGGGIGNCVPKLRLRLPDRDRDRYRQTALAGAAEGTVGDDLRGHAQVGIGQHNNMV